MEFSEHTSSLNIAVVIPCHNEEMTIRAVVQDFKRELPEAEIYVFDNNSTDKTAEVAENAGAHVRYEGRIGKGNVVRTMFRTVEADIYVMVDGDDTYSARDVKKLIRPVLEGAADMAVGDRITSEAYDKVNNRRFHGMGNRLVRHLINKLFGATCHDILSGYRVFNRFFICNIPILSQGFEIETEITLHALDKGFRVIELPVDYRKRVAGSDSKLATFSDGYKIIRTIGSVFRNYKPLVFFGILSFLLMVAGLLVGLVPILEYVRYAYVYAVPKAVLAAALEILAAVILGCGLVLDAMVRQNRERFELRLIDFYKQTSNQR